MRGLCERSMSSMLRTHRTVSWGAELLGKPCTPMLSQFDINVY